VTSGPGAAGVAPAPPPQSLARRALTILLTLRPDGGDRYRATVGVGAEGCDPLFRAPGEALALDAVLQTVPDALAAAEARWRTAPRYPAATPPAPARATGKNAPTGKPAATTQRAAEPARPAPAAGAPDGPPAGEAPARPAAKSQLTLFG
jgi:translation initiation factor IF-2